MSKKIAFPKGAQIAKVRHFIKNNYKSVTKGRWIVIDPGKTAGYAIFDKGQLDESGVIKCKSSDDVKARAYAINQLFQSEEDAYDFMLIEMMRGPMSPYALMFKVGAYMASVNAKLCVEIPVNVWKPMRDENYIKSDREDAILMGKALLELAKEMK